MPRPEDFAAPIFADPGTVSEIMQNEMARTFNIMQAGLIAPLEAAEDMDSIEAARASAGDGWFDRYGLPPAELAYLYEDKS
jgi:hypothetical protein